MRETVSEPLLVSAREAARRLGISERLLWSLTNAGDIPHVRINRRVLYSPEDLRDWIARSRKGGRP